LSGFRADVLPAVQRDVLAAIGSRATRAGFYLGGGTAIAIRLGHRQSVDFDWFTPSALEDPMGFAGALRAEGVAIETTSTAPGTLHARVQGVRCSFLSYRYPLLEPASTWTSYACELASLSDLACMKLAAVAQRGARKDFLDVFALVQQGFTLAQMLELYRRKYAIDDVGHVLAGLCYFDDAEREPMPVMLVSLEWDEVKAALRSWVKAQD
jgi:Nucleotidyl transferase AbiEii toxin, Type IV TA system